MTYNHLKVKCNVIQYTGTSCEVSSLQELFNIWGSTLSQQAKGNWWLGTVPVVDMAFCGHISQITDDKVTTFSECNIYRHLFTYNKWSTSITMTACCNDSHFPALAIDTPVAPFFAWIWLSSDCKYMYFVPATVTPLCWNTVALLKPPINVLISTSETCTTHSDTSAITMLLSWGDNLVHFTINQQNFMCICNYMQVVFHHYLPNKWMDTSN